MAGLPFALSRRPLDSEADVAGFLYDVLVCAGSLGPSYLVWLAIFLATWSVGKLDVAGFRFSVLEILRRGVLVRPASSLLGPFDGVGILP